MYRSDHFITHLRQNKGFQTTNIVVCASFTDKDMMKQMKLVASIPSRWNFGISYSHSFGMSEKYFVILEQPATLSAMKILGQNTPFVPSSVFQNFDLHPNEKVAIY